MQARSSPINLLAVVAALTVRPVAALDNGVGLLPAMGYNTWNDLRCDDFSSDKVRRIADAMVELGLLELGYTYLNVDDCWSDGTGPNGELLEDVRAFGANDSMAKLVEYVHGKGLRFGLYGDRGWKTCALRPGSGGYEDVHARQFASWGVDYLKYDSCWASNDHETAFREYGTMRDALNRTGRPIVYSLCGWNEWYAPRGASLANSWRIAADCDEWANVYVATRTNEKLAPYAAPGAYNDPDMLLGSSDKAPVHLTPEQVQTQFSLWAVMAAPLLIGSRLADMPASDVRTYSNREVIAIDQDALGVQGAPVWSNCPPFEVRDNWWNSPWSMPHEVAVMWSQALLSGAVAMLLGAVTFGAYGSRFPRPRGLVLSFAPLLLLMVGVLSLAYIGVIWYYRPHVDPCQQVWARPLEGGARALCFVNFAEGAAVVTCDAACMRAAGVLGAMAVRDVVSHADLKELGEGDALTVTLPGRGGSVLYRLQAVPPPHTVEAEPGPE